MSALAVCAAKINHLGVTRVRAVATQACRAAVNGPAFIDAVERETGLRLTIISPREEAQLAVAGCLNLIDQSSRAALILDVGGGSTEMSWARLERARPGCRATPIGSLAFADKGLAFSSDRCGHARRTVP